MASGGHRLVSRFKLYAKFGLRYKEDSGRIPVNVCYPLMSSTRRSSLSSGFTWHSCYLSMSCPFSSGSGGPSVAIDWHTFASVCGGHAWYPWQRLEGLPGRYQANTWVGMESLSFVSLSIIMGVSWPLSSSLVSGNSMPTK